MLPWRGRPGEHRAVEQFTHHEIRELCGGDARVGHAQQPDPSQVVESRRQGFEHLTGRPIEVFRSEGRELARLADQQPPKCDDLGAHDGERQPAPQVVESGLQVCGGDPGRELLVQAASERLSVGR